MFVHILAGALASEELNEGQATGDRIRTRRKQDVSREFESVRGGSGPPMRMHWIEALAP